MEMDAKIHSVTYWIVVEVRGDFEDNDKIADIGKQLVDDGIRSLKKHRTNIKRLIAEKSESLTIPLENG